MNWLEFSSSIVGALAWPTAIVITFAVFRRPLSGLVGRVRTARYRGVEFDLGDVQEEIEAAELPEPPVAQLDEAVRAGRLAHVDPRSAVISAWIGVEIELKRLSTQHGLSGSVADLQNAGVITKDLARIIRDLRRLRDEAVHVSAFDISETEAQDYQVATARVAAALRLLGADPSRA